jgi:hypothetical protein
MKARFSGIGGHERHGKHTIPVAGRSRRGKPEDGAVNIAKRLLDHPPAYLRRELVIEAPKPAAPQQPQATVVRQAPGVGTVAIDKLFHQYGKTHLQLVVAEEQLQAARQQAASMEAQLKAAIARLAEQGKYVEALEAAAKNYFYLTGGKAGEWDGVVADLKGQDKPKPTADRAEQAPGKSEGLTPISEISLPKTAKGSGSAADG